MPGVGMSLKNAGGTHEQLKAQGALQDDSNGLEGVWGTH